jgi:LPXTG-motif cell wall-anchored protein
MCHAGAMTGIVITLLVIWLIFVVLGAVLEGLFWLTVVGIVLFLATGAYGWMKRKTNAG